MQESWKPMNRIAHLIQEDDAQDSKLETKEQILERLFALDVEFEDVTAEIKQRLWTGLQNGRRGNDFIDGCLNERDQLEFQAYVCSRRAEDDPLLAEVNTQMTMELHGAGAGAAVQELSEMRSRIRKEKKMLEKLLKLL